MFEKRRMPYQSYVFATVPVAVAVVDSKGDATTIFSVTSVAMLEQCCNHSKQRCNHVVMLCCAENRRCEASRVKSP